MSGVAVPVAIGAGGQIFTGPGEIAGFSFAETAGSTGAVSLYDGTSSAGVPILLIRFPAQVGGASTGDSFAVPVAFKVGLFAVVTGTVSGSVWV